MDYHAFNRIAEHDGIFYASWLACINNIDINTCLGWVQKYCKGRSCTT